MVFDGFWLVFDGFWWFMMVFGWFLMVFDGFWVVLVLVVRSWFWLLVWFWFLVRAIVMNAGDPGLVSECTGVPTDFVQFRLGQHCWSSLPCT